MRTFKLKLCIDWWLVSLHSRKSYSCSLIPNLGDAAFVFVGETASARGPHLWGRRRWRQRKFVCQEANHCPSCGQSGETVLDQWSTVSPTNWRASWREWRTGSECARAYDMDSLYLVSVHQTPTIRFTRYQVCVTYRAAGCNSLMDCCYIFNCINWNAVLLHV